MHADEGYPYETWGVEDCRITRMEDRNAHVLTYTACPLLGPAVGIAMTHDCRTVEPIGIAYPPENAAHLPRCEKDGIGADPSGRCGTPGSTGPLRSYRENKRVPHDSL